MRPEHSKAASRTGWISILVNFLLFGFKYWAGIISGSVALIADAWHTLSDSITSVTVIIGVWFSSRPADEKHPYGHGRAELLGAIIIGVILAVIGFEFGVESIRRLLDRQTAEYGTLAIIVTATSILAKEGLARYTLLTGKKTKSHSLKADAWHHRSDAISSAVILTGIFLNRYAWWIDGVLGILVALLIMHASYDILRDTFHSLLGEEPDSELVEKIMKICKMNLEKEIYPHHLHVHNYGHHTELTLHIKLPKDYSLEHSHDIASLIEDKIRKELDIEATIHMEPLFDRLMEEDRKPG